MNTQILFLLAALCAQSVLGRPSYDDYHSTYHGPLAKPVVLKSGYLADTHKVAAAKIAHEAALVKQSYHGGVSHGDHGDYKYHGPTAIPHVLHDGHIADTHEVEVAKAEHFAAVAKARSHSGDHHYDVPYHGSLAKPVVLKSGYLADTHEVAAGKEHHLEALQSASYHGHYL